MPFRVAIDAMGGDFGPGPNLAAAEILLAEGDVEVLLVGNESLLAERVEAKEGLRIVPSGSVVGMEEAASTALKTKKDASIAVTTGLVKQGLADAMVSAGNTGATMACAVMGLGRLTGVKRPAITTILPTGDHPIIVLDVGANVDCKPEMFLEFAVMGTVYAEEVLGRLQPRVGLLSNGTEDSKGNEQTKAAFKILSEAPIQFSGNMEGRQIFGGEFDVVVCDGFVGNILLKFGEATTTHIYSALKEQVVQAAMAHPEKGGLLRDFFESMFKKMDSEEYGGAPLLGVDGICLICHGGASAKAIANAAKSARAAREHKVNQRIVERLSTLRVPA
jgi:glycerol-3-phosphate acyltransferase PlsX